MALTLAELFAERTRKLDKQSEYRRLKKKRLHHQIVAFDSEGVTDGDGTHRTILLADSTGRTIHASSLSTVQALEFLLAAPTGTLNVWFSGNYDVYMLLGDVPRSTLEHLWEQKTVKWKGYQISFRPKHTFSVKRGNRSFHSYDVFGFFQMSFVAALDEWQVGTPAERDALQAMKDARGVFDESEREKIAGYCLQECRLLVELVTRLRDATLSAGLHLNRWDGAGAIAATLLQSHNMKEYIREWEPYYERLYQHAYFGGRFELAESGYEGKAYGYDIRSAYPSAMRVLPCQCSLRTVRLHTASAYQLLHVRWRISDASWGPFPFRKQSLIYYPLEGEGWYWSIEVDAARVLYPDSIEILDGIAFVSECEHVPFSWIEPAYEQRAQWKLEGNAAQLPFKLGLNSLYGKLAQRIGWQGKRPPYQSYFWAGMVTAHTRAQLLYAIAQNPEAIIWTATDGIMSKEPLNLPIGSKLGEWEYKEWEQTFGIMPGVYQVTTEGKAKWKTRGFGIKEVDFDALIECYKANPIYGEYRYQTTRFVGLGAALMLPDYSGHFRRWITSERRITFFPQRRVLSDPLQSTPPIRYAPPGKIADGLSEPYGASAEWESDRALYDLDAWIDEDQP